IVVAGGCLATSPNSPPMSKPSRQNKSLPQGRWGRDRCRGNRNETSGSPAPRSEGERRADADFPGVVVVVEAAGEVAVDIGPGVADLAVDIDAGAECVDCG